MLKIGKFSKLTKTTIKALRYYDKTGILKPALVDSETSYRYYTEEQVAIVSQISAYRSAGLSCDDISEIINNKKDADILLKQRRIEIINIQNDLDRQMKNVDKLLNKNRYQKYEPCLKVIEPCIVFYCRSFISDINCIRNFMVFSMRELKRTNPDVKCPQPDYCCVIYPGKSFRESNIFVEYVQSVDKIGIDTPTVKFRELEGINAVSVIHYGSYENLRDAYLCAVNFAIENGYEIAGNARERYIDGAWNKESEDEWQTEIQLPVKI